MLINLDELENLNKTEIGSRKKLLQNSYQNAVKHTVTFNENMPRRASFAGSVNTLSS